MRQATGPVKTRVELAKAGSWLCYSRSIICMREVTGPVMVEFELQRRVAGSVIAEVSFA
jgi:hypothetical protein